MATEEEIEILLRKWNPSVNYNVDKSFIHLFKDQVDKHPNSLAAVAGDDSLTYIQLDQKSNQLARYLKALGIKQEQFIGLSVANNLNFIIGLLGILKSGGVYLPLDPNYPAGRLKFMIEDARPEIILTERIFSHLFAVYNIALINLDETINLENFSKDNITESKPNFDQLAYVIYTSGSTGNPKGIMVTHRSLPNIALGHKDYYPSNIRALISGGVCFDVSILIIFHALVNNGTICLSNSSSNISIQQTIELIKKFSINFLICVPSVYNQLLRESEQFPLIKSVSLTGENLPKSLCNLHSKKVPNAFLYNEYGPTECAIGTTIAKIYDPTERIVHNINVGRPLPNTQVYILDDCLNLLPIGAKGEICIAGIGLARGYLNNQNLSAEMFVEVDFLKNKPLRLYRTGDFGRFLPSGDIEFLGRINHQVNFRGRSVDIGEIEHVICQFSEIDEAIVLFRDEDPSNHQLVVYFTSSENSSIESSLRNHLINALPSYMIPSAFVQLLKFPLSPNGKIDRDKLC